ncbi:hypothetical protein [Saccharothrix hoggarensis]|uniref:Competence protein CoiA-like protein n=1 Tax=Saccharothrix hoggarensis TaxID=913853 RepID=A0ABW3QRT4_9PSEU
MDVHHAATVLRRAAGDGREATRRGGFVLLCAECGGTVDLGLGPLYACTTCGKARAPAHVVHRELQALVWAKWGDAAWRARWYPVAFREAEAEIGEACAVHDWCRDSRHRRRVARALRSTRSPGPEWCLHLLGRRTVELVGRRALLAPLIGHPPPPDAPHLSELRDVARRLSERYPRVERRPNRWPWSQRDDDVTRLQDRLWQLLAVPAWRGADPHALWEHAVLAEDWGASSPRSQVTRRRVLVADAVGDRRLVLGPDRAGAPRVRVVPRPEPRGWAPR